jgi:hypothetical protein
MSKKTAVITFFIFLFSAGNILADAVYLKNGNKISGIITAEDEDSVEIEINIGGRVRFSKDDISGIERDADKEHEKIKETWKNEKKDRIEKKLSEVLPEKELITPEEKERLQASDIAGKAAEALKKEKYVYKKNKSENSPLADKLLERGEWFLRETEHFSIFYRDLSQAKLISDKAEYFFEKIAYDFGYEDEIDWDTRCRVYIADNIDTWKVFLKDIGLKTDLVGGFVPNYAEKEMYLCAISDDYIALTFPHELTHLIFAEIAGGRTIPLWLNEGLANYEASVTSLSNALLTDRIKKGRHILLGDILRMGSYPEGKEMRELFYAQSEKMVEFLITQHGRKKFRKFCDMILNDRSFKSALTGAYGADFKDIEDFNIKLVEYIVK